MGDDRLHELNRKELKELCSLHSIRTAGVKHEDIVRLLRSKMYPSPPQTPRSTMARVPKASSPGKEDKDPHRTPGKVAPVKNRHVHCPHEHDTQDAAATPRKNVGSSRKPLTAKSNTLSARRTKLATMKTPAVEQDPTQETFASRICHCKSPLSHKGQLDTGSKASRLSLVNLHTKADDMPSPTVSEVTVTSTADMDQSETGSDASRRVSEFTTDAGPDTLSDFSDVDELRSVSSEPFSKLSSLISQRSPLQTSQDSSEMSPSEPSSSTAGACETGDSSGGVDCLVADDKNPERRDAVEDIFPEFPEDSNFLVGDTEALDLSFLRVAAADPDVISIGSDHEGSPVTDGKDRAVNELDVMDSPMARDYVNYSRGSKADVVGHSADSDAVSVGESTSPDLVESRGGLNLESSGATTSIVKSRDSASIADGADLINDPLALGTEENESITSSCIGNVDSDYGEECLKEVHDGPEIHGELPCFKSNSPPFDSKDFCVAKALVFEREDDVTPSVSLPQPEFDAGEGISSNLQNNGGESVAKSFNADAPAKQNGAVNSSSGENQLADGMVPSEDVDALEADGPDTPTIDERRAQQPEVDLPVVAASNVMLSDPSLTNSSSGNPTPEKLERSNSPVNEKEGYDVKARDEKSASTSTTERDYNKEEGEKEKFSFLFSVVLSCSQLCCSQPCCCSLLFRNRAPRLGS